MLPTELVVTAFAWLSGAGSLLDWVSLWNTGKQLRPLVSDAFLHWTRSSLLFSGGSTGVLSRPEVVFLEEHCESRSMRTFDDRCQLTTGSFAEQ
jgi:hypothetical protein